jgi:hypothetical protein
VVGLSVLILGFASINMATVNRNLMLGRLTTLELGAQGLGIVGDGRGGADPCNRSGRW